MDEKLTQDQFVRIWQAALSLDEIAKKTGLSKRSATSTACYLRSLGVPLQKFRPGKAKRIARLITVAQEKQKA